MKPYSQGPVDAPASAELSNSTVVTFAQTMGELLLLGDAGVADVEVGDDAESQQFAAEIRRLNPYWKPGIIPQTRAIMRARIARPVAARASAVARPREHRSGRQGLRRGPPDDDSHPEPSALNRSWQAALEDLASATEFEALGELARIRAAWLGRQGVAA